MNPEDNYRILNHVCKFLEPKIKIFKDFTCVPCFSVPVLSVLLNTSVGDSEVTLFGISKSYGIASMCLALIAVTTKCKTTIRVKAMNVNF